jgi:arylsulfatase A-like enzyme
MKKLLLPLAVCIFVSSAQAQIIGVNFRIGTNDNNSVDADESATSMVPVSGANWNNITVRNSGTGSVNVAFDGTALVDDSGTSAATLNTTIGVGGGYAEWADVTAGTARGAEGEAGLMQSHLNFGGSVSGETLTISELGTEFTDNGYKVLVFFDMGSGTSRTYGITIGSTTYWTADVTGTDGDPDNDGLMEWKQATGTDSATATQSANYAVFDGLSASSFTIEGVSTGGRSIISGFQVVSNDYALPTKPPIESFAATKTYVAPGSTVALSWETTGADTLTLNPGNIDLLPLSTDGDGTTSVTVNETTTYTITATNADGTAERPLEIAVGPDRPNLVILLVDDMGPQDTSVPFILDAGGNPVSYNFNSFYQTPNMESLAASGMRFTSAYAQSVCSPTRCGIMTGENSARHAVTDWVGSTVAGSPTNWRKTGIDGTVTTLPKLLKLGGYRTIHVGKGHFANSAVNVTDLGFDVNIAGSHWGHPWKGYIGTPAYGGMPGMGDYDGSIFLTRALTMEANKALENAVGEGRPFFLNMCFYAVHAPFTTNPDATGDYSAKVNANHGKFATMIEGMDIAVGAIRQKLVDLGVAGNTLIVFLGDNGSDSPALSQDGLPSGTYSDFPMRGKKGSKWEGGIRVPFIATWAASDAANPFQQAIPIPADSIETDIVTSWDLSATLLDVAGLPGAADFGEDSHTLVPYFKGTPGTHRPQEVVIHYPHNHRSDFFSLIRQGDMKLIYNYQSNTHQLYDLAADPTESNDLAAAQPETVMRMARALAQKLDATWGPRGPLVPTVSTTAPNGNVVSIPNNPNVDVDADGLADSTEDADLDGLVDPGETDPDNDNTDGDRTPDGAEVRTGTDPLDPSSDFTGTLTPDPGGGFHITWPSKPGATYEIWTSDNLADWSDPPLATVPAADPGTTTTYVLPATTDPRRFYRVKLK